MTPRIGYVVARLDRALRREIGALLAPHDLTVSQYRMLAGVDRDELRAALLSRVSRLDRR